MLDRLMTSARRGRARSGTGRIHPDLRALDEHTLRDIGLQRSAGGTRIVGRDRWAGWPFLF